MLVLSFQSRLLGSKPIIWLCDPEPVKTLQKGPPPEKAKLKQWWTYLSQFRQSVHHIQGIKNEQADYISRNPSMPSWVRAPMYGRPARPVHSHHWSPTGLVS